MAFSCSFSKKNGPIMALNQNSHQTVTSVWVRRLFNVCVRVFCVSNAKILIAYIPAMIKMSFIWKDDFFFAKIGIFRKSIAGALPSVVRAYTQPYLFDGRIKLIICQIRHVTIHVISTSWKKKTLDGGYLYFILMQCLIWTIHSEICVYEIFYLI